MQEQTENCRRCGRKLKTGESVLRGFGPVCYQKHIKETERSEQLNMDATMSDEYILIDLERTVGTSRVHYWKQNKHGYTTDSQEAGRFDYDSAHEIVEDDIQGETIMLPHEKIKTIVNVNAQKHG